MKKKKRESVLYLRNLQRRVNLDAKSLFRKVKQALEVSGLSLRRVGIIILSDSKISLYNQRFLNRNRPTDVLSFSLGNQEGEILISAETAKAQAKNYNHSLEKELLTLAVHGFLHLAGYRDQAEKDRRKMSVETERILKAVDSIR